MCRTQPRRVKPAYSERVLHHLLHAALVVVREVSCRAADTGVLTKVEDAASALAMECRNVFIGQSFAKAAPLSNSTWY